MWGCVRNTRTGKRCSWTGLGQRSPFMTPRRSKPGRQRCLFLCWAPVPTAAAGRTGGPLVRVPAFWDTSALIPLVRQGITPRGIALYTLHDAVVWWATPVEIASALARLVRMEQLAPRSEEHTSELQS